MRRSMFFLCISSFFIFSCSKEKIPAPAAYDESLEKYFGTWEFTHTQHQSSWEYIPNGPGGSMVYQEVTSESSYVTTGEISMGNQMGEVHIVWDNSTGNGYYGQVLNGEGHLTCNTGCENMNLPEFGYHHVNDTSYRIDFGGFSSGSSSSNSDIMGIPL